MEIYIPLERDSANSYSDRIKIEVVGYDDGRSILFTLDGPSREFQVDMRKLKRALAALEEDS